MQKVFGFVKQNLDWVIVITIVTVGFVLYANTFGNKMFWDDNDFILNNTFVHSWQFLPQYFSQNIIAGAQLISNYWRPLLLMVFSIEWHLWGAHVFGYHLINLLFHIADALLLFYLLKSLFNRTWLAFLASLVFLIHPLQTEAVTYVNSLGDSLSVFFLLLGLNNFLFFRQTGDRKSFWWSVVCFPLALMSKETAIIYPGLIVLVEIFIKNTVIPSESRNQALNPAGTSRGIAYTRDPSAPALSNPRRSVGMTLRIVFRNLWPSLAIAAFYILLRATVLNFQNTFNLYNQQNIFTAHLWVRILTFFRILWIYLGLLFYPHNLHMERSIEIANKFSPDVIFGLLFFITLLALSIWAYKKHPIISFGALWFLIGLAPTSNIAVPINGLLYEHWLYLPLAGFFLMIFGIIGLLPFRARAARGISFLFFILYLLFLSSTTIARNRQWRDPITFYNQTLQYAPDSYRVVNNLGMAYDDDKQFGKAIELYQRAIALDPANAVAYNNLGNAYKDSKQFDLAEQYFKTAIAKDPNFIFAYGNLINLYLSENKKAEAEKLYQQYQERFMAR